MAEIRSVCVYCGSSSRGPETHKAAARELGRLLAENSVRLVYGGGHVGLMGLIADAVLTAGGEVTGVIPGFLNEHEVAHQGLTELHVVDNMHERKALMAELADAFVALPGGYGTLEELFEVITWAQLGFHDKPIGVLNVAGYFDRLLDFFHVSVKEGFLQPEHRSMLLAWRALMSTLDEHGVLNPGQLFQDEAFGIVDEAPSSARWRADAEASLAQARRLRRLGLGLVAWREVARGRVDMQRLRRSRQRRQCRLLLRTWGRAVYASGCAAVLVLRSCAAARRRCWRGWRRLARCSRLSSAATDTSSAS